MDQARYEMRDVRARWFAEAVWVPLRSSMFSRTGDYGHIGHAEEFYGVGSVAVPIAYREAAERLDWNTIGTGHNHRGWVDEDSYVPADTYVDFDSGFVGVHLVLDQSGNSLHKSEWHLHQDLIVTLGLRHETLDGDDVWVRPDDGYPIVARLSRGADGVPQLLEMKASHLRDYLCARSMALRVVSFRRRTATGEKSEDYPWAAPRQTQSNDRDTWEGMVLDIHEGGALVGSKTAVIHIGRTDLDPEKDTPIINYDDEMTSRTWTEEPDGRQLCLIQSQMWRAEWVEPAKSSPLVRGDVVTPTVFFTIDAEGTRESSASLVDSGRWLWFRPEVITALAHRRGGSLGWYTRETGRVGAAPDSRTHFGVNSLGLVNVYAKDIALLPEWEQRLWSGYNVGPEGKVSAELLMSQAKAEPAETLAPEASLGRALEQLNRVSSENIGIQLIKPHEQAHDLLNRIHRFRSTSQEGLLALAKDVARVTAEAIDEAALLKLVSPPKGVQWRSLKLLEKLLAKRIGDAEAYKLMGPLFNIYDLRLRDAHLGRSGIDPALEGLGIDISAPYVMQGRDLLHRCVYTLFEISEVIEQWDIGPSDTTSSEDIESSQP